MKNEKYSHKSWWKEDLKKVDPKEFNNTTIVNAGFGQIEPFTDVFPVGMTGVIFDNCNLTNCNIPPGNTVTGANTNRHMKEQADGEMWIVDNKLKPVSPLKPWKFDEFGLSKDPKDIVTHASERIVFSPTKKYSITSTKERKYLLALKELTQDTAKLKAILVSEGKI
jgi:hypothetical protein